MNQDFSMHANPLVAKLQKPASELTKADIISYIKENGITMVTVSYTHLRAHETGRNLVCRLLLEKKKRK